MPTQEQFVIPMLSHHMAKQCTKFEVSSFSHSGDIFLEGEGGWEFKWSRDHNYALSAMVCRQGAGTSHDQAVYQI